MAAARRLWLTLALAVAASGSKLGASRIWVKRPGSKKLEIVDSISSLCSENELDEEAMLAVSRGEADDYQGWECGEIECDEDEEKATDSAAAQEAQSDADADADADADTEEDAAVDEAPAATPTPPGISSKMIVGMLAPMAGVQLLKRCDPEHPHFLLGLRGCFTACAAVHTAVDFLLQLKIKAANETELVKSAPNPLSLLMGGGLGGAPQTACEYDLAQLASMRNSFRVGVVVVALMHWKFKWTQLLVYQGVQTLVDLFYHPLVQIHLLGRAAKGEFSRPFGSGKGQPDMAALLKGMTGTPEPAVAS